MPTETPEAPKPLFTANYTLDPLIVTNAASAMDSDRVRYFFTGATIATLVLMIILLIQQPANYWVYVVICFAVSMALGFVGNDTHRIQLRRLARKGFVVPHSVDPELLRYRIDVFDDRIESHGPGTASMTHPVSEVRKFWCDEEATVIAFADGEMSVVPRSSMSNSRYLNLIDFLDRVSK